MKRWVALAAATVAVAWSGAATALLGAPSASEIADFITELDVGKARELLSKVSSEGSAFALERARLSLYLGDCDTASATLGTLSGSKDASQLAEVAHGCARATAGSVVVEDGAKGLWIRLQDGEDRALVPLLSDVAVRARAAIERDLGVDLPRPLRIDLVRDLFSLSAVSGLPLAAAETTGTVAVARWGRVTLISPRAAPQGFPWEDTLAHEITHLALTRATRDEAPLWLQEGLAKRQEVRWRPPQAFDGEPAPDEVARDAMLSGESVGIDHIGPSIAMLPSADAATIAFAEVSSFVAFFVSEMGAPALRALFLDLRELGSENASAALQSVSGYDLPSWLVRWRAHLLSEMPPPGPHPDTAPRTALATVAPLEARDIARRVRVSELLLARGGAEQAAELLAPAVAADEGSARLRARLGKALIASGRPGEAAPLFGSTDGLDAPEATWFALAGRFAASEAERRKGFDLALSFNPYLEEAACRGNFSMFHRPGDDSGKADDSGTSPSLPWTPAERALCEAARKIPAN